MFLTVKPSNRSKNSLILGRSVEPHLQQQQQQQQQQQTKQKQASN